MVIPGKLNPAPSESPTKARNTLVQQPFAEHIETLTVDEVCQQLGTGREGLASLEAADRRKRFGANELAHNDKVSLTKRFFLNFTHLMAWLLWAGGAVGFLAGMPELGIAIWMVNIINGVFSFWQEYKAEKATEALLKLLPEKASVVRDRHAQQIVATDLVAGDLILLCAGDLISADARLIQCANLKVEQSTLTGESVPVPKTADIVPPAQLPRSDIANLVFAGTTVVSGTARAVVFATGMTTEFGKIAHLTQKVIDEPSPLQVEMARVTRRVTLLATSVGFFIFLLATLVTGVGPAQSFVFAMGMIVAFVPEGMLPTVTLSLAMAVQRMARRNALVKRLSAVETLGCTTVICTDKTGTLTKNEMTVRHIFLPKSSFHVTGTGYNPEGSLQTEQMPADDNHQHDPAQGNGTLEPDLKVLLTACCLCNNARLYLDHTVSRQWRILGDPTEAALLVAAHKAGIYPESAAHRYPRLKELPFDSQRKRMSTIHKVNGSAVAYVKGAPRELLALCTKLRESGMDTSLEPYCKERINEAIDDYARNGLRVLAVAMRELPDDLVSGTADDVERDLTFVGLLAMMDPPRPEVPAAMDKCRQSGIRVIMLTGDYGLTAENIARRVGIIKSDQVSVISGTELESMSYDALRELLSGQEVIFARVAPEHKLKIVTTLQGMGQIVAVTGDGVNDAPALKRADIGIAMGKKGTDVAREAADMILLDDNFASIVNAIEEGRAVYANIRKFAVYVFNSNMAEAVPFALMLFSRGAIPLPLTVMQVLSIDLGTDMVPAIALGADPPEDGMMDRPPRSRQEHLLSLSLLMKALLWYGLIEAIASTSAYFYANWLHGWPLVPLAKEGSPVYTLATTMTLAGVVAAQVGAVFCCRSDYDSLFHIGFLTNRFLLAGVAVELLLLALLIYVPGLHAIFHTTELGLRELAFVFAWTPIIFAVDELRKLYLRYRRKTKQLKPPLLS